MSLRKELFDSTLINRVLDSVMIHDPTWVTYMQMTANLGTKAWTVTALPLIQAPLHNKYGNNTVLSSVWD